MESEIHSVMPQLCLHFWQLKLEVVFVVTRFLLTWRSSAQKWTCVPRPAPMRPTPAPELDMAPAPVPTTPTLSPPSPIQRRSLRSSNAPDRLEMSWGTKTYVQAVTGTDLCSLGISDSLHHSDPRGEGDFTEYGCTEDSLAPAISSRQGPVCQIDVKWYDIRYSLCKTIFSYRHNFK